MEENKKQFVTEIIELPSEGHFYPEDNPLSSGKIELFMPTAKHEDILTSRNLIKKGVVIDHFLRSLVADDKVNFDDILVGDKNGLLIASRILLYGAKYNTKITCRSCEESFKHEIDLAELEMKEIDFKKFPKGINQFEFDLPYGKKHITFKLLTHADEVLINNQLSKIKNYETGGVNPELTTRLTYFITAIDGETNKAKIQRFVNNELTSRDSLEFRKFLADITPGMETDIDLECPLCGHEQTIALPMDVNFFWPSGRL